MKTFLCAVMAVSALAVATPVLADHTYPGRGYDSGYGHSRGGYDYGLREQIRRLDMRVDRARERGWISYHEARRLQWQVDETNRLLRAYYRNDGRLTRWETSDLQRRIDQVKQRLRYSRHDYGGYGGWDREDYRYRDRARSGAEIGIYIGDDD